MNVLRRWRPAPPARPRRFLPNVAKYALSIVNNIAEGAGKFSKPDKSRFYTTAIGSATESAAMLDVCLRRGLIATEAHDRGKQLLDRIVAMLVKLCRAMRDG